MCVIYMPGMMSISAIVRQSFRVDIFLDNGKIKESVCNSVMVILNGSVMIG